MRNIASAHSASRRGFQVNAPGGPRGGGRRGGRQCVCSSLPGIAEVDRSLRLNSVARFCSIVYGYMPDSARSTSSPHQIQRRRRRVPVPRLVNLDLLDGPARSSPHQLVHLAPYSFEPPTHLSFPSVRTAANRCTVFMPVETRPKIVCLPSRKGVGARVMKNWEPGEGILVSGCRAEKLACRDRPFVLGPVQHQG